MPKKELDAIDSLVKITGLLLLSFMLLWHVIMEPIHLYIILIPALMIGLDLKDILSTKK